VGLNMGWTPLSRQEVSQMSPAALAYIGDAVYEIYVRRKIVLQKPARINALHKRVVGLVNASAQAELFHFLVDRLTPDERAVARRGRNVKTGSVPKYTDVATYRHSTGLECLIGFLHLCGEEKRVEELLSFLEELDTNRKNGG